MSKKFSRRTFLKSTAAAATAPLILPACATTPTGPRPAPSGRMTLGCIGTGNRGISVMREMMRDERVQVVALCDVNKGSQDGYWGNRPGGRDIAHEIALEHYADQTTSGTFKGIDRYNDYRELLARDDIDAVLLALPDHWHALSVVDAANAGKDIYGENRYRSRSAKAAS
jgi:predicted dehydrogenase